MVLVGFLDHLHREYASHAMHNTARKLKKKVISLSLFYKKAQLSQHNIQGVLTSSNLS